MRVITLYGENTDSEMLSLQAQVFKKLDIEHEQILTALNHADALGAYVRLYLREVYIFFDADAIPLNKEVINRFKNLAQEGFVCGGAQNANHISGSKDYASSACFAFSRKTWIEMGGPSFVANDRFDVAGIMSNGKKVDLLYPSSVQIPKWKYQDGRAFGSGTIYENAIYHAFESRFNSDAVNRFKEKCKEIL